MYAYPLNMFVTTLVLAVGAFSAVAQPTDTSPRQFVQIRPATTFDFTKPFGLIARRTTCAELASSQQETTWEVAPDGGYIRGVLYDSQWNGWIKAINTCFNPHDTISNLDVIFVPSNLGQTSLTAMRGLLSEFADRLTAKGGEWKLIYKDLSSPNSPRVIVYKPDTSVSIKIEREKVLVEFRSYAFNQSREAEIKRASVRPIGVAIGVSTCYEANIQLDGTVSLRRSELSSNASSKQPTITTDTIEVVSKNPGRFYPGATSITAQCNNLDENVDILYVGVKDGPNNSAARDAFHVLASKYKLVEGALIPTKGNGYARFQTSGITIELQSWGDNQDFLVTYMETKMFDRIKKVVEQKRQSL